MSRLRKRIAALEARGGGGIPRRVQWTIHNPRATDLSYEDFVAAEERRLGIETGDLLIAWRVVAPEINGVAD